MQDRLDEDQALFCRVQHPRLVGVVGLYTGDWDLAQEVAQEALIHACRRWTRVRQMASPGAWTQRVALNLAKRHLRRAGAGARAEAAAVGRATDALGGDVAERLAVRAAVAGLPPRQRAALVLRYYADLSVQDTATAMGCAPGTVKALTHQALRALRERGGLLDEEVPDDRR